MDLIDRQAAIKTLEKVMPSEPLKSKYTEGITVGFGLAITWIEQLPAVQSERLKGRWIERNPQNSDKCRLIECNQCGSYHIVGFNVPYEHWIENRNFCERCGADMRCEDDDIPNEYFESGGK